MFKGYYNSKLFTKICWFVSNVYDDEELQENKPSQPIIDKITRTLGIDDVRVTQFPTCWTEEKPPVVEDADTNDQGIAFNLADEVDEEEETDDEEDGDDDDDVAEDMAEIDLDESALANTSDHSGIENVENNKVVKDGKAEQVDAGGDVVMES